MAETNTRLALPYIFYASGRLSTSGELQQSRRDLAEIHVLEGL